MAPTAEEIEVLRQHRLNMQVLDDFQARERDEAEARAQRERRAISAARAEAEARREALAGAGGGVDGAAEVVKQDEKDQDDNEEEEEKEEEAEGQKQRQHGKGRGVATGRAAPLVAETEEGGWDWPEDGAGDTGLLSSQSQAGMAARGDSPVTPRRTEKSREEELKDAKLRQQQEDMLALGRELAAEVARGDGVED